MNEFQHWIELLQLRPHPEGGYFRETYRSAETIAKDALPARFGGDRAFSTAIYYLLAGSDFGALHRIRQDEVWHYYDGAGLTVHVIDPGGNYSAIRLGRDLPAGEVPQAVVPAGHWFGATVTDSRSYGLAGCMVAPGFDFADFEMPSRQELLALFPQHREVIVRLTR
jgi:predicted cupin superfamily sugar epimerase